MTIRVLTMMFLGFLLALTAAAQQWVKEPYLTPYVVASDHQGGYCVNMGTEIVHVSAPPSGATETLLRNTELPSSIVAPYAQLKLWSGDIYPYFRPFTMSCNGKDVVMGLPGSFHTKFDGRYDDLRSLAVKKFGRVLEIELQSSPALVLPFDGNAKAFYSALGVDFDGPDTRFVWAFVGDNTTTALLYFQTGAFGHKIKLDLRNVAVEGWEMGCRTGKYRYIPILQSGKTNLFRYRLPDGQAELFRKGMNKREEATACREAGALIATADGKWEYVPDEPLALDRPVFPGNDSSNVDNQPFTQALTDDNRLFTIRSGKVYMQRSGASSSTLLPLPADATSAQTLTVSRNTVLVTAVGGFGQNILYRLAEPVAVQPPTVVSFTVEPAEITAGQSVALKWAVSDATSVTIAPDVGPVSSQGTWIVIPTATTQYTLTATGPGGTASQQVQVTVKPLEPPQGPEVTMVTDWYAGGALVPRDTFAPGALVTIRGKNLGPDIRIALQPLIGPKPNILGGTTAYLDCGPQGTGYARWFLTSASQLNVQLPAMQPGNCALTVTNPQGRNSKPFAITLVAARPNFQTYRPEGKNGDFLAVYRADGSQVSSSNQPAPGEEVSFYLTGLGDTNPWIPEGEAGTGAALVKVEVYTNGVPAEVLYAGREGTVPGRDMIKIRLPLDQTRLCAVGTVVNGEQQDQFPVEAPSEQ